MYITNIIKYTHCIIVYKYLQMLDNEEIDNDAFVLEPKFTTVLGLNTAYYELNETAAETLVVVHGMNSNQLFLAPLLLHLGGRFRVVAPDLPGHGLSAAPPSYKIDFFVDFLREFAAITT